VEPAAPPKTRVVKFGVFDVDLEAGELRKSGVRQKLVGQPFQVLQFLLEHPQEIVTREQLQRRIWPGETVVDYDLALKKAVNRIRVVLGDSAESPRFIETIPRRGYRFIAPVAVSEGGDGAIDLPNVDSSRRNRRRLQGWLIAAGIVALVVAAFFASRAFRVRDHVQATPAPQIRSLAVLPLQNLSADPAQEYFSDGMTDALITNLAQMGSVRVISRTSSMTYKGTKKSLPEIAHELNVDGIVEGTVQRSGDRVRITAQLIHAPADKHLWANSYERDLRDVFTLERDVTDDIARHVQAQIVTQRQPSSGQPQPVNPKALDAYLQGNYHLNKGDLRGPRDEEMRKAGEFFHRAIDADPAFVSAYIGLAESHHDVWYPSSEDFTIMKASAAKALELAPTSSEAHKIVGLTKWEDWDWIGAAEEARRAIDLNPNNAAAHDDLGDALASMGQLDEGLKEYEIAQQLDPNQDYLSGIFYLRGEYDRSIELLKRTAEAHPDNGECLYFLSVNYAEKGMHAQSVQELLKFWRMFGLPEMAAHIDRAFATSGWNGALLQYAKELQLLMATKQGYFPGILAQVYSQLGDKDRAFYWLEQGNEHRLRSCSELGQSRSLACSVAFRPKIQGAASPHGAAGVKAATLLGTSQELKATSLGADTRIDLPLLPDKLLHQPA
jgi:TolB-like protein/DNA-binding winged helix-turn-helix (wHTH) protein/tetratricopeptide (TPR) repeat protein